MNKAKSLIFVCGAILLASCGGSSGGSSAARPTPPAVNPPVVNPPATNPPAVNPPAGSLALVTDFVSRLSERGVTPPISAIAARTIPDAETATRTSSITQTSAYDVQGRTTDVISITKESENWVIRSGETVLIQGISQNIQANRRQGEINSIESGADYLAYGIFALDDDDGTDPDERTSGSFESVSCVWEQDCVSMGVGATGSDPFPQNQLAALTGTATYSGFALGYHWSRLTPSDDSFPDEGGGGILSLTVDFGDASQLGTIEGSIDGGEDPRWPDITLGRADIGSSQSGFFTGIASATTTTADETPLAGRWGGQFFGRTGTPRAVGGTFGLTSDDGQKGIIGSFGASRN